MKKFFGEKQNNNIILSGEEQKHLAVLRLQEGDEVLAYCGDNMEYVCTIISVEKNSATLVINSQNECLGNPKCEITLFQALPKLDKLEFIVQKATELGISKIVPFESQFTIAKPNANKFERLNKIAVEACKQCGRSCPPKICDCVNISKIENLCSDLDIVLFANETNKNAKVDFTSCKKIGIIVGSEGGFSANEIEKLQKFTSQIGLGERILRCETAAVALCSYVSLVLEN